MAEDAYLRVTREYFSSVNAIELGIPEKKLNKALETYNKYLQKCLIGESPFVAEDLILTIKAGGKSAEERQDREPGKSDSKA